MKARAAQCVIREAAPVEAPLLGDLALRSKAWWGYPPEFINACRNELSYAPDQITDPRHYFGVAECDGMVAGFYQLEELPGHELELAALFVQPGWIGRGIGRALLHHAKQRACERRFRTLVIQSDPHAVAFYVEAGAVIIGERESGSISRRSLPLLRLRIDDAPAESESGRTRG